MPRIKLAYVNVALLASLVILALVYRTQLAWAWHALPGYLSGDLPVLEEVELAGEGLAILRDGGDPERSREVLEAALAIDPNLYARHTLGEALLQAGDLEGARIQFEAYNRIDPSFLPSYLRLIEVYGKLNMPGEADLTLQRGIEYYRANAERYLPQPDETIAQVFNLKARAVYNSRLESLRILQEMQGDR